MKAIVYSEYGPPDVFKVKDMPKPSPKDDEVLIKVEAVSVNFGDIIARNFGNISSREFNMPFLIWIFAKLSFGLRTPRIRILGNSFSGVIEQTGIKVKQFRPGDSVFGYTGEKMGAYAEYLCMHENGLVAYKPSNISHEEASAIPYGALMAFCLLKKVNIIRGQKVLIAGASGGIGSAAVQLVRNHFGAEVTGVCSTGSMDYVKDLGAGKVIDYKNDDFSGNRETCDHIIDVLGKRSWSSYKSSLNQNGTCLLVSFKTKKLFCMAWTSIFCNKKLICALASPQSDDLKFIKVLVEEGIIRPVINRVFPFDEAANAHRDLENKARKGNVVIRLSSREL